MRNFLMFIGFALCFSNCKKEPTISFATEIFEVESKQNCHETACSRVYLEIPKAIGNENITSPINQKIYDYFKEELTFLNAPRTNSYDSLAYFFIQEYEKTSATYPENYPLWQANFEVEHQKISERLYQIVWNFNVYTGGAKGSFGTKVFFFDLKTGKEVPAMELFVNYPGFVDYSRSEFMHQLKIGNNQDLEEQGFNITKEDFRLPDNFYLANNQWFLCYNPSEITAAYKGAVLIQLPKDKVSVFLNPIYFKS